MSLPGTDYIFGLLYNIKTLNIFELEAIDKPDTPLLICVSAAWIIDVLSI